MREKGYPVEPVAPAYSEIKIRIDSFLLQAKPANLKLRLVERLNF
jgi:hypothetical protein